MSCALALAGCGGGDGVDVVAPPIGGGQGNNNTGGSNGGSGGTQTPAEEADFHLQKLYTTPANIELSDEPVVFSVTVKAAEKKSGSAVINKKVSLTVEDSENNGVTVEGLSDQTTNDKGEATYELKLNPNVISSAQQASLLANGFKLKATAKRQNGAIVEQVHTVSVRKKGSGDGTQVTESKLSVKTGLVTTSVSNNKLNPYGDTAVLTIQTKDPSGALAAGVTVGASILDIKGVSLDSSSQVTDSQGISRFNIKIDNDLSKEERDSLIRSGLFYNVNIQEKNGATKKVSGTLPVASPISDYNLSIKGNNNPINAFGDSQPLVISATPVNSNVPTKIEGSKVFITLNNPIEGVTLSSNELIFNAQGQASVTLNVAKNLSTAARNQIAKTGIGYTVSLTEPNYSTTVTAFSSSAYIPQAQNKVGFVSSSKTRISSFGSTVDVVFRVNDNKNAPVAGQTVIASLPSDLAQKGLLLLDNSAQQITNDQGQVKYTVFVPSGLSAANRALLEKAGGFVLSAQAIETSGASSEISSERIQITADSETLLTSKTVPGVVNILKDQFEIVVNSKRPDGSVAVGKSVKLAINNVNGISIQNNQQTTNSSGQVTFTVNVSQDLSQQQRDSLITSGIGYTVTLTDSDGVATQTSVAKVAMPEALYQLNYGGSSQKQLSSFGGSTIVTFRVNNKQGGVIKDQIVGVALPKILTQEGLLSLDGDTTQKTNDKGEVSFTVRVPSNLSSDQRAKLEAAGQFALTAAIVESSGASSSLSSPAITISSKLQQSLSTLATQTDPSVVNVLKDRFDIIVSGKR
ncbi:MULTISPECIES: hypothetical protein, partial [Psychrobacter]|uniref:hypothetical protein n=1 Tax=Psychrobacter TaxID=497 RepID=UPI00146CE689